MLVQIRESPADGTLPAGVPNSARFGDERDRLDVVLLDASQLDAFSAGCASSSVARLQCDFRARRRNAP